MRKRLFALTAAMLLVIAYATPASAITNGRPDGDDHSYVGLVVSFDTQQNPWVCSGSLIAPRLVLTAGHCTDGNVVSYVIFKQKVPFNDLSDAIVGTPYTHPGFRLSAEGRGGLPAFVHRDVGLVVLSEPAAISGKAELPSAGRVDRLKNKSRVDLVGFGVSYQARIRGSELPKPPPYYRWMGALERRQARAELVSGEFVHSDDYLRFTQNPGRDKGGNCYGDSGGPALLGGTDTVLAVDSYGTNANCRGVGYSARVDVPAVLSWIAGFLP